MPTIEISIIEDDDDYRDILQVMINSAEGYNCAEVYPDGESALRGIPKQKPDIVLVDLGLPGIHGTACIRKLKKKYPKILFIVLTVKKEDKEVFQALKAGATGYLLKSASLDKIIKSIHEVFNGGAPMSSQIARKVVASFSIPTKYNRNPYEDILTKREKEVLYLLSKGFLYKQIAAKLFISIETVKSHCHNIYEKMHVNGKTEALKEYYYKDVEEEE